MLTQKRPFSLTSKALLIGLLCSVASAPAQTVDANESSKNILKNFAAGAVDYATNTAFISILCLGTLRYLNKGFPTDMDGVGKHASLISILACLSNGIRSVTEFIVPKWRYATGDNVITDQEAKSIRKKACGSILITAAHGVVAYFMVNKFF